MLPSYMVPSVVVGIDEWPRTSSGKIDRKRLPRRGDVRRGRGGGGVMAPRTADEAAAREAFASVLSRAAEAISVEASFFELGGNSLRAVALARRLCDALGRQVSVADVLRSPTIAALSDGRGRGRGRHRCLRSSACVDGARLLAHAHATSWNQSQLLTVHVVDGATAAYNIPMTHWVDGSHSAWSVGVALGVVMDRHAVLRTTYEVDGEGGFAQRVHARARADEVMLAACRLVARRACRARFAADAIVACGLVAWLRVAVCGGRRRAALLRCCASRVRCSRRPRWRCSAGVRARSCCT